MKSLFIFLYRFRAFISLVLLETVCTILIIQNSQYHRAIFFNSSNASIGAVLTFSNDVVQYFRLRKINESLAEENARIKNEFNDLVSQPDSLRSDSIRKFNYIKARVINNSVNLRNNLITINAGKKQGIRKDMGVIAAGKVVGKTRYIGNNYTILTSLLHTESMISAMIKNKVKICTVQWNGADPYVVDLLYVPRHYRIAQGDTILTNGFSGIFPEGILIGYIESINLSDDSQFFDIKVKLAMDFYNLAYVEVVENLEQPTIDSVEQLVQ